MKSFLKVAAQGEITIRMVDAIPDGCTPLKPEGGKYIIGHSETGHHHVLGTVDADVMVLDRAPEGMRILYAILENPTSLDHLRDHDTHESIEVPAGIVEFRIAREHDHYAELARQSQD